MFTKQNKKIARNIWWCFATLNFVSLQRALARIRRNAVNRM